MAHQTQISVQNNVVLRALPGSGGFDSLSCLDLVFRIVELCRLPVSAASHGCFCFFAVTLNTARVAATVVVRFISLF